MVGLICFPAASLHGAVPPVIDSLSATPSTVAPGGTVAVSVTAHDPDCTAGTCASGCGQVVSSGLTSWSATGGSYASTDAGVSGSPYAASAVWQAPAVEGSYTLTVTLSDSGTWMCGGRQTSSGSLTIQVSTVPNEPPRIGRLTATPPSVFPDEESALECVASDPDGDAVSYSWSSDLGTVTAGEGGRASFSSSGLGVARIVCTATDGRGGVGTSTVLVAVSSVRAERSLSGSFAAPQRLAVDSMGDVYVADAAAGGLVVMNLFSAALVYHLPLESVTSVAVDWADRLVVGSVSGAVVRERDGRRVMALDPGEDLGAVADVAVDPLRLVYGVLYGGPGRVVLFDAGGSVIGGFGSVGDGAEQVKSPSGLAFTPSGQVVVADSGHARVKVFTAEGGLVLAFGQAGGGLGRFVALDDVAVDGSGVIYASDAFQSQVQSFDASGAVREAFGAYGTGAGHFRTPAGVAVSEAFGRLLVASLNGQTVESYGTVVEPPAQGPAPQASLSVNSLSFAAQAVGTQGPPQAVVVSNAGTAPLGLRSIAVTAGFVQGNDCGPFLDPGAQCTVLVSPYPLGSGPYAGTLVLETSAAGGRLVVSLNGSGVAPAAVLVAPGRLVFAEQEVGTQSPAQTVVLTNTGDLPLALVGVWTEGPFPAETTCGSALVARASCQFRVAFAPTAAGAQIGGRLVVASDAAGSPHAVALVGSAVLPTPTIAVANAKALEGDGEPARLVVPVRLSRTASGPVAVDWVTESNSAIAGEDFEQRAGVVVVPAGERSAEIVVTLLGDTVLEQDETFFVELANPVGGVLGASRATATILDDELCPGPNLAVNPGAEGYPVEGEIPGWREVLGGDWQRRFAEPSPASGKAAFWPGTAVHAELAQEIGLAPYADWLASGRERFWVSTAVQTAGGDTARLLVEALDEAGSPVGAYDSGPVSSPGVWRTLEAAVAMPPQAVRLRVRLVAQSGGGGTAIGAWFDEVSVRSLRAPALSVADVSIVEGQGGVRVAEVPVTLACAWEYEVSGMVVSQDGTAVVGDDYLPLSAPATVRSGETTAWVSVPIYGDRVEEPHEELRVVFLPAGIAPVVLLAPAGTLRIVNDDSCPLAVTAWRKASSYPLAYLELGGVEYGPAEIAALLSLGGSELLTRLAQELAATQLNLGKGTPPAIGDTVTRADAFLGLHPLGSELSAADAELAKRLAEELHVYNGQRCP